MQFPNVKLMLRWFFRELSAKETPKGLRSAASSAEVIGREPSRIQNVDDVIQTHAKIIIILRCLSLNELKVLERYYGSKKTMAGIERDSLNGKYVMRKSIDMIESKIEDRAVQLKIISEPDYEAPRYLKLEHQVVWIEGAKEIARHLGRSVSWFYQFGLQDGDLKKIINKVGSRWEAKQIDLDKWREG